LWAFSALSLGLSFIIVASFIAALCVEVCGLWRQPRLAFAAAPGLVFVGVLLVLPLLLFTVSLSNFNSRYLIVQYPLLFLLPAVFMVRGLNFSRWRHPARALTVLTVAFNIVLSLAYYHYQGQRIARADHFLPSFRKMESVRRLLKADAGPNCRIRIEDRFVENKNSKTSAGDVIDLVEYVRVCEQVDPLPARSQCLKTYRVRDPADAPYAGERIIYAGNGIVITSVK
jgi:hypothetical protein